MFVIPFKIPIRRMSVDVTPASIALMAAFAWAAGLASAVAFPSLRLVDSYGALSRFSKSCISDGAGSLSCAGHCNGTIRRWYFVRSILVVSCRP